jgi:hypothetical protein
MEAALAASATHLDRGALLESLRDLPTVRLSPAAAATFAAQHIDPPVPPLETLRGASGGSATGGLSLPDVSGLPARVAVRRLHALGLRVGRVGDGDVFGSEPRPGTRVLPGDTIRLRYRGTSYD